MPDPTAFEEHLDQGLRSYLDPHAVGSIPAWRMPEKGRARFRLLGGAGAALTAKIAVVAAIAVMAAGATTEAVITHSANPVDWARHVTQQVQPGKQPQPATTSPAAGATQPSQAASSPAATPVVVSAPALPTVSAPAVPTPVLPLPSPTPLPSLP